MLIYSVDVRFAKIHDVWFEQVRAGPLFAVVICCDVWPTFLCCIYFDTFGRGSLIYDYACGAGLKERENFGGWLIRLIGAALSTKTVSA